MEQASGRLKARVTSDVEGFCGCPRRFRVCATLGAAEELTMDDCFVCGRPARSPCQSAPRPGSGIFAFCLENSSPCALCENSVGRRPCAAAGPPAGIFMPLGGHPAMRVCLLIFFYLRRSRAVPSLRAGQMQDLHNHPRRKDTLAPRD